MKNMLLSRAWVRFGLIALAGLVAFAFAGASADDRDESRPQLVVPRASCGANDHPETALQGQVPAALRASGFEGFNCNLQLIGQSRGDGANWQTTEFRDEAGHRCAYHGTASPTFNAAQTANRTHLGVPVIDITRADDPTPAGYLSTTSMLDPWESLKVNERRQLLGADNGQNGGGGPEVDFYDISGDCRFPQLLSSVAVGTADGSTGVVHPVIGHEGSWAPDGLTYYGGDLRYTYKTGSGAGASGQYYAVDATDPSHPSLITSWTTGIAGANVHGLSISDDGRRGYFVSLGGTSIPALTDPALPATDGLLIYDLSDIQSRKPNPQVRLVSKLLWKDGAGAQHTIPVRIDGKPYVIFVDEAGSGGFNSATQRQAACAAGLTPYPLARIIDISDETRPRIVSRLGLEVHDPANCSKVLPDLVGMSIFTYGSHYCSVDNKHRATTLACGYFNSGVRVFDIRNPRHPREIAYWNPPGETNVSPGSNHTIAGNFVPGGPDWCSAQVHLHISEVHGRQGTLWTTCQDNGLVVLKFENGVWPFEDSTTPPGEQN